MKEGRFFSDAVANVICSPKFVPIFLNGCEPSSGNVAGWLPSGLVMGSYFRLRNFAQFYNELSPPEGNTLTPEEFSQRMSYSLADPKYESLATFVRYLRLEQGVARPEAPQIPVHIPSSQNSPGHAQGLSVKVN